MMEAQNYISPETKVIEVMIEGIVCMSGYAGDSDDVELF